jgi:cation:H+ antiporter
MFVGHGWWLVAGVLCAAAGGEMFLRGTLGFARTARLPPLVVAATIAAFATSSPELGVSVMAALEGEPRIALGDALGSNVVNIALIVGLSLAVAPLAVRPVDVRRDLAVALAVPVVIGLLALDGNIARIDALVLLMVFVAWLVATIRHAGRLRGDHAGNGATFGPSLAAWAAGLALLVLAGHLVVTGATGIAERAGIDEFVVGATIVAAGTSTPELAATIVAMFRGRADVGLGTILGSNIFNGLFIVPVAALIAPMQVGTGEIGLALFASFAALVLATPGRAGVGRARAPLLLALYIAYVIAIVDSSR